jgi:hypothetical protein
MVAVSVEPVMATDATPPEAIEVVENAPAPASGSVVTPKPPSPPTAYSVADHAVRKEKRDLRHCYRDHVGSSSKVARTWKVSLEINRRGRIDSVTASAAGTGHAKIKKCVEDEVRTWSLGRLSEDVDLVFDLKF